MEAALTVVQVHETMNSRVTEALLLLSILLLAGSPVSAYSSGAVNLFTTGNSLVETGNYSGAYDAYNKAVSLEPAYYEAWNGIADVLNRDGQFGEALAASNRSLEINPGYVEGWINRGQILYNIGYYYEDVAKDMGKADIFYADQLAAFEKAVALDPNNAEAWFNKGYALAGLKRYDEAIAAFDQVYKIDPSYPNLLKNREIAVQLRENSTPGTTKIPVSAPSYTSAPVTRPPETTPATKATPLFCGGAAVAVLFTLFLVSRK